jgi:hypothetical protein
MSDDEAREIRQHIGKMYVSIGAIETLLKERCGNHSNHLTNLDGRVHNLEKFRNWAAGGLTVLSGLLGYFLKAFGL